jgi:pimeloyl-ACP methyl ester carboxylesterase
MKRRIFIAGAAATGISLAGSAVGLAQETAGTATPGANEPATLAESGYLPVNGLEMYYELHGQATDGQPPLLLLHGGFLSIATSFSQILPRLAATRLVVAVEQQGHGHTADIDRPLTFEQEADDTAEALRQLGLGPVDVFGYSDGGNVALGLAIQHPEPVRKLAIAGTNVTNKGLIPGLYDFLAELSPEVLGDELRELYEAEAPRPEDWPVLVEKVRQQVVALEGWTPEQLQGLTAPTLVIIGDEDIVTPEHALEIVRLIPNAHLAVLPMRDHLELGTRPEWLLAMLEEFYAAPIPEATPAAG